MNKCCEDFIRICYFNHLETGILEWDFCPKCGEQIRSTKIIDGQDIKTLFYNKPTLKYTTVNSVQ